MTRNEYRLLREHVRSLVADEVYGILNEGLWEDDGDGEERHVFSKHEKELTGKKKVEYKKNTGEMRRILNNDFVNNTGVGRETDALSDLSPDALRSYLSQVRQGNVDPSDVVASDFTHTFHDGVSK